MSHVLETLVFSLVFVFIVSQGCSVPGPQAQGPGSQKLPLKQASGKISKQVWTPTPLTAEAKLRPCPDRVDTARAAGLAGTVVGTVVGSVFGMPYLGIVYKVAGYTLGFATGNSCDHVEEPAPNGKTAEPTQNDDEVTPAIKVKQKKGGELAPLVLPSQSIKEETL